MPDVEISLIMPGARPHLWHAMMDRMKVQTVSWEVIAVGPHPPVRDMPENFTYIYSVVKPHQAHLIAAKAARGRLLCYWNDDWILSRSPMGTENIEHWKHKVPHEGCHDALRPLVQAWDACKHPDAMVAPHMPNSHPYLFFAEKKGYLLHFGEVFTKEAFFRLGAYDTRFIAIYAGNDYAIRLQAADVPVKILDAPLVVEIEPGGMWGEYWMWDRSIIDFCWMENYPVRPKAFRYRSFDEPPLKLLKTRKLPILPYDMEAKDLLYKHQGPRGKWKDTCKECYEQRNGGCQHVEQPKDPSWTEMIGRPDVEDVPKFARVAAP